VHPLSDSDMLVAECWHDRDEEKNHVPRTAIGGG
jgi:hypothetical protein